MSLGINVWGKYLGWFVISFLRNIINLVKMNMAYSRE